MQRRQKAGPSLFWTPKAGIELREAMEEVAPGLFMEYNCLGYIINRFQTLEFLVREPMFYFYVYPVQNTQITPSSYAPALYNGFTQNEFYGTILHTENQSTESLQREHKEAVKPFPAKPVEKNKRKDFECLRVRSLIQQKTSEKLPFADKHNIVPNNINHIIAFIQRKSKSLTIIEKIIAKFERGDQNYSAKGFYSYQSYMKSKLSIHVNLKALTMIATHLDIANQIFSTEEQIFYNRVTQTAILYYLKVIAPVVTLNSQRLKNTNRSDHLKAQRFLSETVLNMREQHCRQASPDRFN